MLLLKHTINFRLCKALKTSFLLGFLFVQSFSFSQLEEYDSLIKELNGLTGLEKLEQYEIVTAKLKTSFPVLVEKVLKDAIRDSEIEKDTLRLIQFHNSMGGVKHNLGQYSSSIDHFQKSLEYSKQTNNLIELNKSKVNMTMVYLYNRNYDKGIANLEEAILVLKDSKEQKILGVAYSNMANLYREKGDFEQAVKFGKEAIKIQKVIGDDRNLGISYANIGSVLGYQKYFQEALVYFGKSSDILMTINAKSELAFLYLEYSKVHDLQELHAQATAYANLALELARSEKLPDYELKALNQLALIDYNTRNFEASIGNLIAQMVLQDSMNQELQSKKIRETAAIYSVYEAERKSTELKHQVVLEKSRFNLLLAVAIFVSLLLVLMIIMWSRIRAKNIVLFEQGIKTIDTSSTKLKEVSEHTDSEKYKKLYSDIIEQFEKKKVHLNSKLTMGMLSDVVKSNSNYVSKSINIYFGSNFNSMINFYRVNEAKKLIEQGDLSKFTMETIASNCGFTSLSVFNRSFKKETGITPTYFNKSLIASTKW